MMMTAEMLMPRQHRIYKDACEGIELPPLSEGNILGLLPFLFRSSVSYGDKYWFASYAICNIYTELFPHAQPLYTTKLSGRLRASKRCTAISVKSRAAAIEALINEVPLISRPFVREIMGTSGVVVQRTRRGNPIFKLPGQSKKARKMKDEKSVRPWPGLGDCKNHFIVTNAVPAGLTGADGKTIDWATYGWMCDKKGCMARGDGGSVRAFCKEHKIDCCLAHSML